MILFPGRHLMGVLECHQLIPPNKMVELKTARRLSLFFLDVIMNPPDVCIFFFQVVTIIPTDDQMTIRFFFRS
jgi:hypothetical protein